MSGSIGVCANEVSANMCLPQRNGDRFGANPRSRGWYDSEVDR